MTDQDKKELNKVLGDASYNILNGVASFLVMHNRDPVPLFEWFLKDLKERKKKMSALLKTQDKLSKDSMRAGFQ